MQRIVLALVLITAVLPAPIFSDKSKKVTRNERKKANSAPVVIWEQPHEIKTRDLFYGPGGKTGLPKDPFKFIEEDHGGSSPKFVIVDGDGVRWKVKLAEEVRPETAATRLMWAVGYFADINYYRPNIRVEGLPKLKRGQKYVIGNGLVQRARLERIEKGVKEIGNWSWFDNPFVETQEFNGLRVMMALINNWDLKESNNAIYDVQGREMRYVVSDLGATFGKTGDDWSRSKGDLKDYLKSSFIEEITPMNVDLVLHSRPPIPYVVAVPYYCNRTQMEKVAKAIPRAHAKWIGQWLGQLSFEQTKEAFRAAGYTPQEVEAYARKLRERISQLNGL